MRDVLAVNRMEEIPELNKFQCGTYMMHSLDDAKRIIDQGIGVNKNEDIALSPERLKALGSDVK